MKLRNKVIFIVVLLAVAGGVFIWWDVSHKIDITDNEVVLMAEGKQVHLVDKENHGNSAGDGGYVAWIE